ncbi:Hsp20/alpha crystallin family protein [Desulfopila inferna]|uniref:Hsp20/alpha crystallin family protein n=1 Tax=Desulfopila inferna TaxID=468528 RepID=UPI001963ACF1|nr:Hsp20/alpha crystallin family protein [Desulfopila inferna]MBM9605699.1 Hsp20/alpha crystallin family protein [Desulfopila inferna]
MWTSINDFDRMFGNMDLLRSRMNRLFSDFDRSYGDDYGWGTVAAGTPRTNLYDNGDKFVVMAEVPGMTKDDIDIKIQGNYLEVSGSRKADGPEGYKVHRSERPLTTFTRSFTIPSDVDAEKVEASLKNGLLTLSLPKAEAAKPKQINIR